MAYTAPRTWVASEVVTAAIMNQHVRDNFLAVVDRMQIVRKPSDVNIISNATLANDADLKFTAVAGQTYIFQFDVMFSTSSSAIDAQVAFSFPAGTLTYDVIALDAATATTNVGSAMLGTVTAATSGATPTAVAAISGNLHVTIQGTYVCTTGGTVNLMLAQNTLTATNLTVKAGSFMTAFRAAA